MAQGEAVLRSSRNRSELVAAASGSGPRSGADNPRAFRRVDFHAPLTYAHRSRSSRCLPRLALLLRVGRRGVRRPLVELDRDDLIASDPEPFGIPSGLREPVVLGAN